MGREFAPRAALLHGDVSCQEVELVAQAGGTDDFHENKIVTGRYFMERVMPETSTHLARISAGADTMMVLPTEAF